MAQNEEDLYISLMSYFDRPGSNFSFKDVEAQGFKVNKYVKPPAEEKAVPGKPGKAAPFVGKPKTPATGKGDAKVGIPRPVVRPVVPPQPVKKIPKLAPPTGKPKKKAAGFDNLGHFIKKFGNGKSLP